MPFYNVKMAKIQMDEGRQIKQLQREESQKILNQVKSLESGVLQKNDLQSNQGYEEQLLELELNSNAYYRNYVEGMDQSGSSFYIESLKHKMNKSKAMHEKMS